MALYYLNKSTYSSLSSAFFIVNTQSPKLADFLNAINVNTLNYQLDNTSELTSFASFLASDTLSFSVDPDSYYLFRSYAFSHASIKHLNLSGFSGIGMMAFASCKSLLDVTLTDPHYLDYACFVDCSLLSSVYAHDCYSIAEGVFENCSSLSYVDINNCKSVGYCAFNNCCNLTELLADSVTYVDQCAFANTAISSFRFSQCNFIGSDAFRGCINLEGSIEFNTNEIYNSVLLGCQKIVSFYAPIASYVGALAFGNCSKLEFISIPEVTYIEAYAFLNCSSLSVISLPMYLEGIGSNVFNGCTALKSVYIPLQIDSAFLGNNIFDNTPITNSSYFGYFGSIFVASDLLSYYTQLSVFSSISSRFVGY